MRAHWPALLAADFFTTEVWTRRGLVTYYTAFVIELHSRRVHVLGHRVRTTPSWSKRSEAWRARVTFSAPVES